MNMNGLPPPEQFYPELIRAIRSGGEEPTEVTNVMISNIERSRHWFESTRHTRFSSPTVSDFIKDIVLSMSEVARLTPLALKRISTVLEKHKQYKIIEEMMGRLPGGPRLVILDGGDYGIRTQIDWRMCVLPKLVSISLEGGTSERPSRVVETIRHERAPAFLRRVGAKGLSQSADGMVRLYFADEESAVLQKMMLSGM